MKAFINLVADVIEIVIKMLLGGLVVVVVGVLPSIGVALIIAAILVYYLNVSETLGYVLGWLIVLMIWLAITRSYEY